MRKILLHIVLIAAVLLAAGGCSRPKTIPRKELKEIFKDAFLVNSYYDMNPMIQMNDSLDIYRPILKRHGYKVRDLEYTIQNFSRQKSAKISNVVEDAIQELKDESEVLERKVAVLDTIDAIASRIFMREVFFESQITVAQVRDTSKLRIIIPVEIGSYEVSYVYQIDSLEENRSLRVSGVIIDSSGQHNYLPIFNSGNYMSGYSRKRNTPARIEINENGGDLELLIGNYPRKDMKRPHLTIDSLRIVYFLPQAKALDSINKRWININFPPYAEQDTSPQDSIPLRADSTGVDSMGVNNP